MPGNEKAAFLFQTDSLLPVQYFDNFRRKTYLEPEKGLMLAALEDALTCFQSYFSARDGKRMNLFREAEKWIFEEDTDWLFSFENICEVLGFHPQYIRRGLARWKEMQLAELSTAKFSRLDSRHKVKKPGIKMLESERRLERTGSHKAGLRA